MFQQIKALVPRDPDYPERARQLDTFRRVLDGTLYDVLPRQFHEEYDDSGEYVPVSQRAPSVRTNLCRTVVEDSVSLLFSEGRFPAVTCADKPTAEALADLVRETHLNRVMTDAAIRGSIGSVAILLKVLQGRVFFDVLDTLYLAPTFDPLAPDTLTRVTEKYKVKGAVLKASGYPIGDDDLHTNFWFQRVWDTGAETWFVPWTKADEAKDKFAPRVDTRRTVEHALGFVPMVWVKNLPGGEDPDGRCTFAAATDIVCELDYLLSAGSRALMYQAAPRLLIRGEAQPSASKLGPGDAILLDRESDARLLETTGDASASVVAYADKLRERALEACHGNRASPDKLAAAQSGRAIELLHMPLVWLADQLRISYGDAVLQLARMVVAISNQVPLTIAGKAVAGLSDEPLSLRWARWFASTHHDRLQEASTLEIHRRAGNLSRETAVAAIAADYDVEAADELARIARDEAQAERREQDEGAQVQVRDTGDAAAA